MVDVGDAVGVRVERFLLGSLLSALLATVVLRVRNRHYRRMWDEEQVDDDADGIPDVYQRGPDTPGSPGRRRGSADG